MAGITGQGTTYNLPNFTGELFAVSREDTPFLSAIGGLTGGKSANGSPEFTWSTYDLRDAEDDRQRTEGADAPTAEGRVRGVGSNVLEIHQEQVAVSYTKQASDRYINANSAANVPTGAGNAVQDELGWQIQQELKQIARDVNASFLTGTYQKPSNNSTARKTRGLLSAITTNTTAVTAANLTADHVLDLMQEIYDNGGIRETDTRTILVGSRMKRRLSKAFVTDANYREQSRNVGGVNLQTIETDFGQANVMLEPGIPADVLVVVSLEECAPVFLEIPGKGHFFAEPLAKTGAADKVQLYGEIGLEYGLESHHGKLTFTDSDASSSSSSSSS